MSIRTIFVVGAGQMGGGIAQVAAQAGINVILNDIKEDFVQRGLGVIGKNLARNVEKGKMTAEEKDAILARIKPSVALDDAAAADIVIEAAVENLTLKAEIFSKLCRICPPATILATNTSSLSITEISASTRRPDKVIGMHFFNPVPVMKLVEVIRGLATSDETFAAVQELSRAMGKDPEEIRDYPGFVVNRLLIPMINEAVYAVYEGVASVESIDNAMKLGANHPMGPLALADLIGLDTCLAVMEVLHQGFGDSKYRPCPLLRNYVKSGWLGRKSGRGFYSY